MSTPKIKVYRLEKGYNRDSDNDIQTKVNSELLPFIEKPTKSTDAYYLTGVGEQLVQWGGKRINLEPLYYLKKSNGAYEIDKDNKYVPIDLFPKAATGDTENLLTTNKIYGYPNVGFDTGNDNIVSNNWVKNGFYSPRLGYFEYVKDENGNITEKIFRELESENKNEVKIAEEIKKVRGGEESDKNYYTEKDFLYAHPLTYSNLVNYEDPFYVENYFDENGNEIVIDSVSDEEKIKYVTFSLDENAIGNSFNTAEKNTYTLRYYLQNEKSSVLMLENYPIYNENNYHYKPQLFNSIPIELKEFDTDRYSTAIACEDTWIYDGNGKPLVTFGKEILNEGTDYQLIYSYNENVRSLRVRLSEEYMNKYLDDDNILKFVLHYNDDSCLIEEKREVTENLTIIEEIENIGEEEITYYKSEEIFEFDLTRTVLNSKKEPDITVKYDDIVLRKGKDFVVLKTTTENNYQIKIVEEFYNNHKIEGKSGSYTMSYQVKNYEIDSDTGLIDFFDESVSTECLFTYYRKKEQKTNLYVSEFPNWTFGHLRENPDIFFGEKDYPGDEAEEENGTPLYAGLKPSFISEGYQIDYFRGSLTFNDGLKATYRSEATKREERDKNTPETFVRANFSYYPEIHNVFRQKLECIDEQDGFTYQVKDDMRYSASFGKRWIMKSDDYQPMFFQNFTDVIKTCTQYLSTAPNYDGLEKKPIVEVANTENEETNNVKLKFILPMIESKFVVFKIYNNEGSNSNNVITKWNDVNHIFSFVEQTKDENGNIEENTLTTVRLKENAGKFVFSYVVDETTNEIELTKGDIQTMNITLSDKETELKIMFSLLNSYSGNGVTTHSLQIISAEVKK